MSKKIVIDKCDRCPYVRRSVIRGGRMRDKEVWNCVAIGSCEIAKIPYEPGYLLIRECDKPDIPSWCLLEDEH